MRPENRSLPEPYGTAIAAISVVGAAIGVTTPLLAFEMEARGASATFIGLNTAVMGVSTIVTAPQVPRLAAMLGTSRAMLASLALGAAMLLAFHVVEPLWLWFPIRFVFGAALSVLFVLSEFWINAAAPDHRRGFVMGVYATVLAIGFAVGPGILAVLGTQGPAPYLAGAALFALAAWPILLAARSAPRLPREGRARVLAFVLAAPAATLAGLIVGAVEQGGMAFLPLYGAGLGMAETRAVLLVSVFILGNVAVQIPVGLVSDRMDRRKLLLAIGVAGLAGTLAIPAVAGVPVLFEAVVFVWGGVLGALYTVGLAHLGARFRGHDLAAANAAFVMCYSLGFLVGPPALGAGMDLAPPHGMLAPIAVLLAVYCAVVALRLRCEGPSGA